MASYVFCRVCDERHDTYEKALQDLRDMVRDERYYTRNDTPPKIMRRTPMVGIGAHGGRGLFVMGACARLRWERLGKENLPYKHRIEVCGTAQFTARTTRWCSTAWASTTSVLGLPRISR